MLEMIKCQGIWGMNVTAGQTLWTKRISAQRNVLSSRIWDMYTPFPFLHTLAIPATQNSGLEKNLCWIKDETGTTHQLGK